MRLYSRRLLAVGVAVLTVLGFSAPAHADPVPKPGQTDSFNGQMNAENVTCYGYASSPHASGLTLQWEGHITCSTTGTILQKINVWLITGNGDNQHSVLIAQSSSSVVSTWNDIYDNGYCNDTTMNRYQTSHYGWFNGIKFSPFPSYSEVVTVPCDYAR